MAVGLLFDGVGTSAEQYYQVFNEVTDNGTQTADGLISHHAGPTEGGFCVIEVWESQEAVQRFFEDRLGKALAAANMNVQPKLFEIVNSRPT
jgi:heme-degrading monooxygenase HmoA